MAACKNFFYHFTVLSLFILVEAEETMVGVHVSDDMPPKSEVGRVNCTGLSEIKLWGGQEFHFGYESKLRMVCSAIWRDKDGIWMPFEPVRDKGHPHVYSSVREDGFYFGYDQHKWTKLNEWHS